MEQVKLSIPTMKCGGCASTVEEALKKVPGILQVSVDLGSKSAEVALGGETRIGDAIKAVEGAGHQATPG
jgi:copper chaperone CopZ